MTKDDNLLHFSFKAGKSGKIPLSLCFFMLYSNWFKTGHNTITREVFFAHCSFPETYLPYINGVVTHVKILKEGLEKLGHEVLIVTADASARRHYKRMGSSPLQRRIKRFYNYGVAPPISHRRLQLIEAFHPDIIHIHNEFGIGLSGVMAAKMLKVPLVYTLHTMYDDYLYYISPPVGRHKRLSHRYFKFLAKNASALTGPSKKCEEYFRQGRCINWSLWCPTRWSWTCSCRKTSAKQTKTAFRPSGTILTMM